MQAFDFKNQIYLNFFLLKHTKGSPEAAFDDLCILGDESNEISRLLPALYLPEVPAGQEVSSRRWLPSAVAPWQSLQSVDYKFSFS